MADSQPPHIGDQGKPARPGNLASDWISGAIKPRTSPRQTRQNNDPLRETPRAKSRSTHRRNLALLHRRSRHRRRCYQIPAAIRAASRTDHNHQHTNTLPGPGAGWRARGNMNTLISINEAAARGIKRLRRPAWVISMDHIEIDIVNGKPKPWIALYTPFNQGCNGYDPIPILYASYYDAREWEQYNGPLPNSDEYQTEQARFTDQLLG